MISFKQVFTFLMRNGSLKRRKVWSLDRWNVRERKKEN